VIGPRWRKVFYDFWGHRARTALVMLTIAVGVFAVGFVGTSFPIVLSDMDADFQSANPHAAIIYTEQFGDDLLVGLRGVQGAGEVEGRRGVTARVRVDPETTLPIELVAIPPLGEMQVDILRPESASANTDLGHNEVLIERSALVGLPVHPGDTIALELLGGKRHDLRVVGLVRDVTVPPFMFLRQVRAFVSSDTMHSLDGETDFNQVYLTVGDRKTDDDHVKAVAQAIGDKIERSGHEVYFTLVLQPGRHFASDISKALGAMMGFLGGLAVLLSAFLVANTVNAMLAQHVRQIGIMKAIGGSTWQLVGMYGTLILCYGLLAFVIAVPLSAFVGYSSAQGTSQFLNFELRGFRFVPWAVALQAGVALVVPPAAAAVPVLRGTQRTVREALTDYGLAAGEAAPGRIDRLVQKFSFLPRPLLISLRNAFRRKARLILTLSTLTLAGSIFIAVFNLKAAFDATIAATLGYWLSDVNVSLARTYRMPRLEQLIGSVPGVAHIEGWGGGRAEILSEDRTTSQEVDFLAPPAGSLLVNPTLTSGRWLLPEDENAIVIGNHLLKLRPDLEVGDEVEVRMRARTTRWRIIGIYQMAGNVVQPIVFANYEHLAGVRNEVERVSQLRIVTEPRDPATETRIAKEVEALLDRSGIAVSQITTGTQNRAQQSATTDVLVYFLMMMAVLIAVVGGLGLMSTMSMNVLERTREIGVMRALGASDWTIQQIVIVEGVLVGLMSWAIGIVLAVPLSQVLDTTVGISIVTTPLDFVFSAQGVLVWLAAVIVISAVASLLPARSASRLTIREVLAYE
jgi:putative ABC transport system permease protein